MNQEDLFGKLDALLEKRAPDVLVDKGLESGDFPIMTEVVTPPPAPRGEHAPTESERRALDRRASDRRMTDRRQAGRRENDPRLAISPRPTAADPQLEALLSAMEQRLADLFIRQQLRMEDAMRKALGPQTELLAPELAEQLQDLMAGLEKRLTDNFTRQQFRTEDVLRRAIQAAQAPHPPENDRA